ncbi:MAG: hypothetical protein KZQ62_10635, partial [Candidatus Thiodiazotropha sp. (ex Lucinoma aequizonata)]|nr:hypothetical protein [Candidatus Thiodiazotropha sp. (ex Lucinoma aequizonata)]MCU7898447.1 hypothetical protein [Candidatus Thiodiazotropha sp. (ex Lucinoma aequizonata)]MCU7909627.1 hypothetical protein [Candidatus Thiodiazotropha sp. (ex Lucinoma aequizonata)]
RNDSTASRMRSLSALHLSLSVAIPAIQPRLRLSGTNPLRSAFHGGQRSTSHASLPNTGHRSLKTIKGIDLWPLFRRE